MRLALPLSAAMYTIDCSVNMAVRHKHLKLDQEKLDRARRFLGVSTEQETVERALDLLIAEASILQAHERVAGVGGVSDPWTSPRRARRRK